MWEFIRKKKDSNATTDGLSVGAFVPSTVTSAFPRGGLSDAAEDDDRIFHFTQGAEETRSNGQEATRIDITIASAATISGASDDSRSAKGHLVKSLKVGQVSKDDTFADHRKHLLDDIADVLSDDVPARDEEAKKRLLADLSFLDDAHQAEEIDEGAVVSAYASSSALAPSPVANDRSEARNGLDALTALSFGPYEDQDIADPAVIDDSRRVPTINAPQNEVVEETFLQPHSDVTGEEAMFSVDAQLMEGGSRLTGAVFEDSTEGEDQRVDDQDVRLDFEEECGGDALVIDMADQEPLGSTSVMLMDAGEAGLTAEPVPCRATATADYTNFEGSFDPLAEPIEESFCSGTNPGFVPDAQAPTEDQERLEAQVSIEQAPEHSSLGGVEAGQDVDPVDDSKAMSDPVGLVVRERFGSLSDTQGRDGSHFVFDIDPFRIRRAELDALLIWGAQNKAGDVFLQTGLPVLAGQAGKLIRLTRRVLDSNELSDLLNSWSKTNSAKLLSAEAIDFRHETKDASGRRYVFRCAATQCQSRIPGDTGFALVCRVIPAETPSLSDLDVEGEIVAASIPPDGMVLVTGPTGSGKSTLLGAILKNLLQTRPERVLTLEDPIEFDLLSIPNQQGMVMQCQVGRDYVSFPSGITSFLRQKPNYILIGEARDRATIEGLCRASETGHGVYSTVHTRGVINTIPRMVDEYPVEVQWGMTVKLVDAMRLIVHQRLVPGTERGYVAIRSFLAFDQSLRDRLISGGQAGFIKTISEALETQGLPLLVDAEKKLKEGRIAQRTYDLLAATQSADNYH